jgi:hypothetical protein
MGLSLLQLIRLLVHHDILVLQNVNWTVVVHCEEYSLRDWSSRTTADIPVTQGSSNARARCSASCHGNERI